MRWLGDKPFHALLVLSEKPGKWAMWKIALIAGVLMAGTGWIWAWATGDPVLGWVVGAGLWAFVLADWGLLAVLPHLGLSYGMVQLPLLVLSLCRCLLALLAVPFAPFGSFPVLLAVASAQVLVYVLMAYGTLVEPFRLKVDQVEVTSTKLDNPGKPLRIVQLSDLHVERLTRRERDLLARVAELAPDLIVLTGDFLSTSYSSDPRALDDLRILLAQLHAPGGVYAVWGTPEVDLPHVLRPVLVEEGIIVLEDEAVDVTIHGQQLWLMGLLCRRDLELGGAHLRGLVDGAPSDALTLLLHHTPDLMPQASAMGVDLVLAGHTHGGQWRLPGFGAILTSSHYWKRYEAGHYQEHDTHLYVSRGIGMEGFGAPRARFFCPPEVVAIRLTAQGSTGR
jgi:predicted MPP superfamily phosphohydrolase